VLIPRDRRAAATRDVLDAINRPDVFVWTLGARCPPHADAVLCLDLPTHAELQAIAASGSPVLLISPGQLAYLKSIAASLTPLSLPVAARLARTAADSVRTEVQARLDAGHLEPELAILEPLFERYDPIEVAAAALAVRRSGVAPDPAAASSSAAPQRGSAVGGGAAFAKLFVNVGKKDRVGAKDLVGALTREIGLAREQIGRIVVREAFSVVEVEPAAAERAVQGLSTTTIRSRRVQARPYREA
jgi:ATP-dependent RNA helicase DeaD